MNPLGRNTHDDPRPPPSRRSILLGMGGVSTFLAAELGAIAWANRWLGDRSALTRQQVIDRFEAVFGTHPGFRRNHAKGVAVTGFFDSTGAGRRWSGARVLARGRSLVTGRFSLSGGDPYAADSLAVPRGLALAIGSAGAEQWRTAMLDLPVFTVNSAEAFYAQQLASRRDPTTGEPDPGAMADFLAQHPASAAAMEIVGARTPSPGFADSRYSSLHTFELVSDSGERTRVRWSFVPQQDALPARPDRPQALFDALVRQLNRTPLRWDLHLTLGRPCDPVDPTLPWPDDRQRIEAGTLTLTHVETERTGNARDLNFDPLVLPDGIEPSDDPLLSTRSSVYAASYRLRTREPQSAPAVRVDEVSS